LITFLLFFDVILTILRDIDSILPFSLNHSEKLAISSHKSFSLRDSELFCLILIEITTNPPTTTPIPSDYPDNPPQYNKSHKIMANGGYLYPK